jgi:hypothetical protein
MSRRGTMSFYWGVGSDGEGIKRLFGSRLEWQVRIRRLYRWVIVYIDAVDVLNSISIGISLTRSLPICIFLNLLSDDIYLLSIKKFTAFLKIASVLPRLISDDII